MSDAFGLPFMFHRSTVPLEPIDTTTTTNPRGKAARHAAFAPSGSPQVITEDVFLKYTTTLMPRRNVTGQDDGVLLPAAHSLQESVLVLRTRKFLIAHKEANPSSAGSTKEEWQVPTKESIVSALTGKLAPFSASRAVSTLQSNSKKSSLAQCVSTLTAAQHLHYRGWVGQFQSSGKKPPAEILLNDYPDFLSIVEFVEKEQSAYKKKLKDSILQCDVCSAIRGEAKNAQTDGSTTSSAHFCQNHNFMTDEIEAWAKQMWHPAKVRWLEQWLIHTSSTPPPRLTQSQLTYTLSKASLETYAEGSARPAIVSSSRRSAAPWANKPKHSRKRDRSDEGGETGGSITPPPQGSRLHIFGVVSFPPLSKLPLQQLALEPTGASPSEHDLQSVLNGIEAWRAELCRPPNTPPPAVPRTGAPRTPVITISKSAMIAILTSHLSSFRNSLCLPFTVTTTDDTKFVHIHKPISCLNRTVSRKVVLTAAAKQASLLSEHNGNGLEPQRPDTTAIVTELQFAPFSNALNSPRVVLFAKPTSCVAQDGDASFQLTKVEYNHKGYNILLDDVRTYRLEEFSKSEVVEMMALLTCIPRSTIRVVRVCAYTQCVMAVELITKVTFFDTVLPNYENDKEIRSSWQVLHGVLGHIARNCFPSSDAGLANGAYVLRKSIRERDFVVGTVQQATHPGASSIPAKFPIVISENDISSARATCALEESADAVCTREYLPPCVWPHKERIPFTFEPDDSAATTTNASGERLVINRTTPNVRDPAVYAASDKWSHPVQSYHVDVVVHGSIKTLATQMPMRSVAH